MARYKVLHSIAHNVGQTFVGSSHVRADDHLMGLLLADARRTRLSTLTVDILSGQAAPAALVSRVLARAVDRSVQQFPELIVHSRTELRYVTGARMELSFDLATERPVGGAPGRTESPYLCRVCIDDDRGKTWVAELRGWSIAEQRTAGTLLHRLVGRG
jgi:hypothetical protein